jgi:hypothetical protein
MSTLTHLVEIAAVVVAGTMVGSETAVAVFFHPRISALDDTTHARAAQALAVALGRVMPFWYGLTFFLSLAVTFLSRPAGTPGHGLAFAAAALFGLMIAYTVIWAVPINNQVARWRPEELPTDWRQLRRRWDRLHAVRVGALWLAYILLVVAALWGDGG